MPKPFIDQARPVWITREYRDALESLAGMQTSTSDRRGLMHAVAAWDAAPADAADAATKALRAKEDEITHSRAFNELHTELGAASIRARAVLCALGMPRDEG